jgi:hypothetical protein
LRALGHVFLFETAHLVVDGRQVARRRFRFRGRLAQRLGFDLARDFKRPKVADEGAFLGREAVGLLLERLEPFAGPAGERLGAIPIGRLGEERNGDRRNGDRCDKECNPRRGPMKPFH